MNLTSWRAQSSHVGYFISHRLLLGADVYVGTKMTDGWDQSNYFLSPFVRYYATDRPEKGLNLFAQLGFGTVGEYGSGSRFETNFHLGVGLEKRLTENVAASALLRYNARATGLNYTELALRINAFLGGQQPPSSRPLLAKNSLLLNPAVGSIRTGHRGRDNTLNVIADLNFSGGYFLTDQLLLEAGLALFANDFTSEGFSTLSGPRSSVDIHNDLHLGVRYLPFIPSRLRPYLLGRGSYSIHNRTQTFVTTTFTNEEFFTSTSEVHLQVGAGALYPLSGQLVLDAELGYAAPLTSNATRRLHAQIGLKVVLP